ncbi:SDR family oxidoreductase [Herbiconiux sp. CPCC 205763]|uniref:SDR family oxidoreductase n=1 Tax=Herbiconiux aconitum TaxID=2970913 RepID=A0ABT2GNE9_9MICO|nr:SDR family oxidoreductase [Herbiconiux aconitum]MCS5717745.1 SDR family oxidoreductase [Herbiconiux aconitum]
MTNSLQGQTALVTGSTSGIGRAIALRLAGLGAHVIVSGRDDARGGDVVERIRAEGGSADFVHADLSTGAGAARLADAAAAVTGQIDILVNNAGVFPFASTADTTEDIVDQVLAVNIKAPLLLTSALIPTMAARGTGSVVNVGSVAGSMALTGATAYSASKAAIHQLTRVWVAEYATSGVRFNTVAPGYTETEGSQANTDEALRAALVSLTPAGRGGRPDEIADAVAFLVGDDARYIHGALLTVDGGSGV